MAKKFGDEWKNLSEQEKEKYRKAVEQLNAK